MDEILLEEMLETPYQRRFVALPSGEVVVTFRDRDGRIHLTVLPKQSRLITATAEGEGGGT